MSHSLKFIFIQFMHFYSFYKFFLLKPVYINHLFNYIFPSFIEIVNEDIIKLFYSHHFEIGKKPDNNQPLELFPDIFYDNLENIVWKIFFMIKMTTQMSLCLR